MKARRMINCKVVSREGKVLFVHGYSTLFGLVITPYLNHDDTFDLTGPVSITYPVTGYRAASGTGVLKAIDSLKRQARRQRLIYGSFRGALDSVRREVVIRSSSESARK